MASKGLKLASNICRILVGVCFIFSGFVKAHQHDLFDMVVWCRVDDGFDASV